MANAKTASSELKNKTNVHAVGDRTQEATAEDFQEIGEIVDDHAIKIDALTGAASPNPNYGVFTSLLLLNATHPIAVAGAYAIIDVGVGQDAQIALWDDNDTVWVLQETTSTSTTQNIEVGDTVINKKVSDINGDFYLIVSGTYEGPDSTKLESYSKNSIYRGL